MAKDKAPKGKDFTKNVGRGGGNKVDRLPMCDKSTTKKKGK